MNKTTNIGNPAPDLIVSEWLQGDAIQLSQLTGRVVLIEVFQLNCPGCFLYSLPQAVDLHQRYHDKGLVVLGLATAFEDFELNTQDNLKLLLEQHKVIGETQKTLTEQGRLIDGLLPFHIPFTIAMDKLKKLTEPCTDDQLKHFIEQYIPDFSNRSESEKMQIESAIEKHLNTRTYSAETFNLYRLQGTPNHIIIDKNGILKACEFGHFTELEWLITNLLTEKTC